MKILILNYEYPPIGGGGGVISKYIAEILASRGHTITVLSAWFRSLKEEEIKSNLRIIRVKSKRQFTHRSNPLEMWSWIRESKRALDRLVQIEKFDLTFANFVLPGGEVAYYLKRRYNIPYVVMSHGHDVPWVKPYSQLMPLHLLAYYRLKRICLASEKNFVQSAEMKENLDRFTGRRASFKNRLIPNGVDSRLFGSKPRSNDKLNIVFVGRLVAQKNPMSLLKAIYLFSKQTLNFHLSIYGDGRLRRKMQAYVDKHDLGDRVTFFGKIEIERLASAYQCANLMVAPSVSEGMSVAILEALAGGVFVIATKVSGNSRLIKNGFNGELVDTSNPQNLLNVINRYYREKFLARYAVPEAILAEFRQEFDWSNIVSEYERELAEAIYPNGILTDSPVANNPQFS